MTAGFYQPVKSMRQGDFVDAAVRIDITHFIINVTRKYNFRGSGITIMGITIQTKKYRANEIRFRVHKSLFLKLLLWDAVQYLIHKIIC
jgi:hypothetical protein